MLKKVTFQIRIARSSNDPHGESYTESRVEEIQEFDYDGLFEMAQILIEQTANDHPGRRVFLSASVKWAARGFESMTDERKGLNYDSIKLDLSRVY